MTIIEQYQRRMKLGKLPRGKAFMRIVRLELKAMMRNKCYAMNIEDFRK